MRLPVEALPQIFGAIVAAILAVVLLRVGRRRAATVALALFLANAALTWGFYALSYAQTETYPFAVLFVIGAAFGMMDGFLVACFGAMLLAERTRVPRALRSFATYLVPGFGLFALVILRPELAFDTTKFVREPPYPNWLPWNYPMVLILVDRVIDLAWTIVPVLLVRWALTKEAAEEWMSTIVIAVAMACAVAYIAAFDMLYPQLGGSVPWMRVWTRGIVMVTLVCQAVLVVYLLRAGSRRSRERRLMTWGGALLIAGFWAMGAVMEISGYTSIAAQAVALALTALPLPLIASYALLRHQLLGIDVRVRWAISKSTIAAVFIAVFFVASEAAQQFFGETLGSTYVGIAAAGALVFAMAPLQRAAERLAEKAVPAATGAQTASQRPSDPASHQAYRRAVRLALRDRVLTHAEELELAHLAEEMGIGAGMALVLRREVEAEAARGEA